MAGEGLPLPDHQSWLGDHPGGGEGLEVSRRLGSPPCASSRPLPASPWRSPQPPCPGQHPALGEPAAPPAGGGGGRGEGDALLSLPAAPFLSPVCVYF